MFSAARWRLTVWFAVVFAVILVVIGGAVFFSTRASLYSQVNDDLRDRVGRLESTLLTRADGPIDRPFVVRFPLEDFRAAAGSLGSVGYSAALSFPTGQLYTQSYADAGLPEYDELADEAGNKPATTTVRTDEGEDLRLQIQPVGQGDEPAAYIVVARSIEPEQEALRRLVFFLVVGGAVGLGLACAGGYWLAGRALRPIQHSMDAQRTFVADASHELRTPLSLIRANAEVLRRQVSQPAQDAESLDDIIKETDHLSYLVGQMLTLARADVREAPFASESVDLSRLAGDITREARVLFDAKGIALSCENAEGLSVMGDEQRLRELMLILLDNALKYTDAGGNVTVGVAKSDGHVRLSVADSGRGIPPEDIPHVFDRFYRVDKARSREMGGTGLGLAIAKWITDAHGGTIALDSMAGVGTTVTVELREATGAGSEPGAS